MEEGPEKKDWADPVTGEIFLLKLPSNEIMCKGKYLLYM
jgi:hypothetical protein